jgi:hypothetical protein
LLSGFYTGFLFQCFVTTLNNDTMKEREIIRNAQGQIINDIGVTFNQWAQNLKRQYYQDLKKLGKIKN